MTNNESQILINRDGNQFGPYSIPEAKRHFLSGNIVPTDTAKVDGGEWLPVTTVLGIAPPPPKPISPPLVSASSTFSTIGNRTGTDAINSLDVSDKWKQRFRLIEKIGWDKGMWKNYWNFRQLSLGERFRLFFNIWGFLFGPFYYLVKGMWVKGLFLLGIQFILAVILDIDSNSVFCIIPGYCAGFASYDYYLFKVKGMQWQFGAKYSAASVRNFDSVQVSSATVLRKCPYCAEDVLAAAIKCTHCGSDLSQEQII